MGIFGQKMGAMVVVVWVAMMAAMARGQSTPSCAANLVQCAPYINNSTKPPDSCCGPLRNTVKNQLSCLCTVYNSGILNSFNISVDKALQLSRRCGIDTNLSACSEAPGSNPSPGGNGSGSAHRATWFGISGLISLFFFSWSILA